jgi:hypothetical protein
VVLEVVSWTVVLKGMDGLSGFGYWYQERAERRSFV